MSACNHGAQQQQQTYPTTVAGWYKTLIYSPDTSRLTDEEIDSDRRDYFEKLDACESFFRSRQEMTKPQGRNGFNFFSAEPPHFLLSYQHRNNADIFKRFAEVYRKMFPEVCFEAPHVLEVRSKTNTEHVFPKRRCIRVGFVSGRMSKLSSVMKDRLGVIKLLDRKKFTVALVTFSDPSDKFGHMAKDAVDEYYRCNANDFIQTRNVLASLRFDIIVYCELGFGPHTYPLAHCRLAPLQLTTWGHSDTSGIPTIDHYISSSLYELDDEHKARTHYSENLILHKSLCTYYYRPFDAEVLKQMKGREHFFLPSSCTIYLLIQTPFKIVSRFLECVSEIIKRDSNAILVMTSHPTDVAPAEKNYKTLEKMLTREEIARVRVFPWLPYIEAQNLIYVSDVLLDSYPFGGCNTSIESLSVGKPLVTLPSEFLYGRFTLGFYKKLGVMDLVAESFDDYVAIALRVGNDPAYRNDISCRISKMSQCLFEDTESVREWNDTLYSMCVPNIQMCDNSEVWLSCLDDFMDATRQLSAFLWKDTLATYLRNTDIDPESYICNEETNACVPFDVACLGSVVNKACASKTTNKTVTDTIIDSVVRDLVSNRMFIVKKDITENGIKCTKPYSPHARTIVLSREKFEFIINVLDDLTATSIVTTNYLSSKKKKGNKTVLREYRSIVPLSTGIAYEAWNANATKSALHKNNTAISGRMSINDSFVCAIKKSCNVGKYIKVRIPPKDISDTWMNDAYGTDWSWMHDINRSCTIRNTRYAVSYVFIPPHRDVTNETLKSIIQNVASISNRIRMYVTPIHESIVKIVKDTVKSHMCSVDWIRCVGDSVSAEQLANTVVNDAKEHAPYRLLAAIFPFMTNTKSLFPEQLFDVIVCM